MKSIKERAREFVDAPCDHRCKTCNTLQASCRFYNDQMSFIAGAESEHVELTRWHDPKKEEFPKELEWKPIQLKLTQPFSKDSTIRGGFFGAGDFVVHGDYWPERQILGWRYIPE